MDDGLTTIPVFLKVLYMYGFADRIFPARNTSQHFSSVGGGLGLRFRLFYHFNVDFKVEAAYSPERREWNVQGWIDSLTY